jgi:hypothetical protein
MFKKVHIINKKRFTIFILFSAIFLIFIFSKKINSINNEIFKKRKNLFLSDYEKEEVIISAGDRAWNIQKRLAPNSDIRKILYAVKKINKKSIGNIKPGEKLIFLKEK